MSTDYPEQTQVSRSSKIGIIALILAFLGLVGTLILSYLGGTAMSVIPQDEIMSISSTGSADAISTKYFDALQSAGVYMLLSIVLGGILGLTAIILGIVSIVKKNGRLQGVGAIILAIIFPIISTIVFGTAALG